jgi:plasmid stabilization system protein ParE
VKLEYSGRAGRQAEAAQAWWEENRPKNPLLFADELYETEEHILRAPYGTPVYQTFGDKQVRRKPMPETEHHVYYYVQGEIVRIVAVWGARKKDEPELDL